MPRLRLGVALLVPPPPSIEIDGLRRACGDGGLGRVPAHLTLVPPVNVNRAELGAALAVLRRAAASVAGPIDARLGPVRSFLPDTPVLYLDIAHDRPSVDWIRRLRDAVFVPPLARRLTWPFVPHVTLADEMDVERIPAAVVALADYEIDVTFDAVTLLREGIPGRFWSPIADARLGQPAVIATGGLPVELWWSSIADPEVASLLSAPVAARGFVLTARRGDLVLGVAHGRWRDGGAEIDELVVSEAAGTEDIERHLRAAAATAVSAAAG